MWTNFARCGNPSTDQIEWKAYSADDQNVMDIATARGQSSMLRW